MCHVHFTEDHSRLVYRKPWRLLGCFLSLPRSFLPQTLQDKGDAIIGWLLSGLILASQYNDASPAATSCLNPSDPRPPALNFPFQFVLLVAVFLLSASISLVLACLLSLALLLAPTTVLFFTVCALAIGAVGMPAAPCLFFLLSFPSAGEKVLQPCVEWVLRSAPVIGYFLVEKVDEARKADG